MTWHGVVMFMACGYYGTAWHGIPLRGTERHGVALRGTAWQNVSRRSISWHGMTQRGTAHTHGTAWNGIARHRNTGVARSGMVRHNVTWDQINSLPLQTTKPAP